jgi:hypothetical protein
LWRIEERGAASPVMLNALHSGRAQANRREGRMTL